MEAALGHLWEHEPVGDELAWPRHPTQRRRIKRCGLLLGLDPEQPAGVVEQIRKHLGLVGTVEHELARRQYAQQPELRARGAVIVAVRCQLGPSEQLIPRLLVAGWQAELWGRPWLWDPCSNRRVSLLLLLRGRGPQQAAAVSGPTNLFFHQQSGPRYAGPQKRGSRDPPA